MSIHHIQLFSSDDAPGVVIEMRVDLVTGEERFSTSGQIAIANPAGQVVGYRPIKFDIPATTIEEAFAELPAAAERARKLEAKKMEQEARRQSIIVPAAVRGLGPMV